MLSSGFMHNGIEHILRLFDIIIYDHLIMYIAMEERNLPFFSPTPARRKLFRLRKLIEKEDIEGEKESQPNRKLTISIGVATFPIDANKEGRLIEAADSALYQAKESGRNKVCLYNKKPQRQSLSPSTS